MYIHRTLLMSAAISVFLWEGASADPDVIVVVGQTTNVAISADQIEQTQANDLADIFRQTPSVTVGGSVGVAQKVYVRGVEDTLLNVTVDGAQQTGTLFHHIGRVNIEPELLKTVELQAGAGEATAGFGAIGGAIRFETKDVTDLLQVGENFGALVKAGWFSNDGYKASLTAYGRLAENWGVLGSIVYVDRDNMEDGNNNELFGTSAEQWLGYLKLSGEISPRHYVSVSYEHRDEEGEYGQRPNWPALEGDTLFPANGKRQTVVANYRNALGPLLNMEATGYYTKSTFAQDRFDRWGLYSAGMETFGFDLRNTSRFNEHEIIVGVEHRNDTVSSEYLAEPSVWGPWAWDPAIGNFEEEGRLWGAYAQGHFQIASPLLLSIGGRYDSYDLEQITYGDETSSDGFSGNVGLRYDVTSSLSLSAGHAQAFRGKEVGDAFTLERAPGTIDLDPNLEPEKVNNTEIGIQYDDGALRGSASVYRMTIDDVILDQLGQGIFYENVGEFKSKGFELRLGYTFKTLSADVFYTTFDPELNDREVEGYEEIGLANSTGDRWNFNLGWAPTDSVNVGVNITHVQDLNDITVLYRALEIGWIDSLQTVDKPGYTVADIYVEWQPRSIDGLRINVGVQNLFDEHYRDHSSVADYNDIPGWGGVAGLYEAGRDIRISVAYDF